jgi:hypothetical protein
MERLVWGSWQAPSGTAAARERRCQLQTSRCNQEGKVPRKATRSYQPGRGCLRQTSWLIRGKLGQLDATAAHRRGFLLVISYSQHISALLPNKSGELRGFRNSAFLRQGSKCRYRPFVGIHGTCLAACMTRTVLIILVALGGCSPQSQPGCSQIENLARRDAATNARAALARGDRRLLMLNGPFGAMGPPGVTSTSLRLDQVRIIEGTSNSASKACDRLRGTAETYAMKYNRILEGEAGR